MSQTQKSPVAAGPICNSKSTRRDHTKLSPRIQRLLKALLKGPQSSRDLMHSVPCNNAPEYIRQLANRHGINVEMEKVRFTTIDGIASWYGLYWLPDAEKEKASALLQD